jgi:hypothetical protein
MFLCVNWFDFDSVGIRWRHYYGPNGPRAPPKLFMWPANEIGEVHYLESEEGKWYDDEMLPRSVYSTFLP